MKWIEISVTTTSPGSEVVSNILNECGSYGSAIYDKADLDALNRPEGHWDMIDEALYDELGEFARVCGYFRDDETLSDSVSMLKARLSEVKDMDLGFEMGSLDIKTADIDDEDWVTAWRKHYKPMRIGERFLVCPSWETCEAGSCDIVIKMDPGTAFGTGAHETTAMCIEMLEETVKPGNTVIDVGCGTAILAIGSVLIGAERALAVDIDPLAVSCANGNVLLNGLEDRISVRQGDLLAGADGLCDTLLSNIVADVIIKLCPDVPKKLKKGGSWICSGIIDDRRDDVYGELTAAGFRLADEKTRGSWVAMRFTKDF